MDRRWFRAAEQSPPLDERPGSRSGSMGGSKPTSTRGFSLTKSTRVVLPGARARSPECGSVKVPGAIVAFCSPCLATHPTGCERSSARETTAAPLVGLPCRALRLGPAFFRPGPIGAVYRLTRGQDWSRENAVFRVPSSGSAPAQSAQDFNITDFRRATGRDCRHTHRMSRPTSVLVLGGGSTSPARKPPYPEEPRPGMPSMPLIATKLNVLGWVGRAVLGLQ